MSEHVIGGLSLKQYAAVYAALAEGFPLDVVLETEGIPVAQWPALDGAWAQALTDDLRTNGGSLQDQVDTEMLRLQQKYKRRIPPLDEDVGAWFRFFRAWSSSDDPVGYLQKAGMLPTDMARLHRLWMTRMVEGGPDFLHRIGRLAQDESAPPPVPRPQPLELRPSAAARHRRRVAETVAPQEPAPIDAAPPIRAPLPKANGGAPVPARRAPPVAPPTDDKTFVDGGLPFPLEELQQPENTADVTAVPESIHDPFAALLPPGFQPPPAETVVPTAENTISTEMNLAQYAAICAELEIFPEKATEIFIKYGVLNAERRQRIDHVWQERLANQTEKFAEWRQLYHHFREHFVVLKAHGPKQTAPEAPAPVTVGVDQDAFPETGGTPKRAAADPSRPFESLSLENYANMVAELAVEPRATVFARYGLEDEAVRQSVIAAWDERLSENDKEAARFDALYEARRAALRSR